MKSDESRITCPHCGAENPRSPIVTACHKCHAPLADGEQVLHGAPAALSIAVPVLPSQPGLIPPTQARSEITGEASDSLVVRVSPAERIPEERFALSVGHVLRRIWRGREAIGSPWVLIMVLAAATVSVGLALAATYGEAAGMIGAATAAAVVIGGGVIGRACVAASFYDLAPDPAPEPVDLGGRFVWGVTVRAKRPMRIDEARIVLSCQEYAIRRAGKHSRHYEHKAYERTYASSGAAVQPGEEARLEARISVPAGVAPSYPGMHNWIKWAISFRASVAGLCPNIGDKVEIIVWPQVAPGEDKAVAQDGTVPEKWLAGAGPRANPPQDRGVAVSLDAVDGATCQGTPVISAGSTRKLRLTVRTSADIKCRGAWYEVRCRVHGQGTEEKVAALEERPLHEGSLGKGQILRRTVDVTIPPTGPPSFKGRYVNCEWVVRVRIDMPGWRDRCIDAPFLVTPWLGEEPDSCSAPDEGRHG